MDSSEFKKIRSSLGKTQKVMAQLLGLSIKAIHSYEQGWRKIPHHVERQLLFLLFKINHEDSELNKCWDILKCSEDRRNKCPAWEFNSGDMCFVINATICSGKVHKTWQDKIDGCKKCEVFNNFFHYDEVEENR